MIERVDLAVTNALSTMTATGERTEQADAEEQE